jgi:hypothetical protein
MAKKPGGKAKFNIGDLLAGAGGGAGPTGGAGAPPPPIPSAVGGGGGLPPMSPAGGAPGPTPPDLTGAAQGAPPNTPNPGMLDGSMMTGKNPTRQHKAGGKSASVGKSKPGKKNF